MLRVGRTREQKWTIRSGSKKALGFKIFTFRGVSREYRIHFI